MKALNKTQQNHLRSISSRIPLANGFNRGSLKALIRRGLIYIDLAGEDNSAAMIGTLTLTDEGRNWLANNNGSYTG